MAGRVQRFLVTLLSCISITGLQAQSMTDSQYLPLQKEVLGKLTGAVAIKGTQKLKDRASQSNRKTAAAYLKSVWEAQGLTVQSHAYATGENLYGIVKAQERSEEYIIVGAHYDSVANCPGANDNGSGVAVVTALVAEFAKNPPKSKNLLFVAFDEEEKSLKGSKAFAKKIKQDPMQIHSVHTYDQVAWDSNNNRAVELELPYNGAKALYETIASGMTPPVPLYVTQESGSDHNAFRALGFPAVGLTEEYHHGDTTPHMHTAKDTFKTIHWDYLDSTTQLALGVIRSLTE